MNCKNKEEALMATVKMLNMKGEEVGTIDLKDEIFAVEINETLVHKAVVTQMANSRQGTQKALTRAEVRGGGRKPWRQKGTGHARQGSIRAPQWKGGGMVFAVSPRDYSKKMNKKEKRFALKSALSATLNDNKLIILDELSLDEIKTKKFTEILKNLKLDGGLFVLDKTDENVILSARNIKSVKTSLTNSINVYDILKYGNLVLTKAAVEAIEEVYA